MSLAGSMGFNVNNVKSALTKVEVKVEAELGKRILNQTKFQNSSKLVFYFYCMKSDLKWLRKLNGYGKPNQT